MIIFRFQHQPWCSATMDANRFVQSTCADVYPKALVTWDEFIASWYTSILRIEKDQNDVQYVHKLVTSLFINQLSTVYQYQLKSCCRYTRSRIQRRNWSSEVYWWAACKPVSWFFESIETTETGVIYNQYEKTCQFLKPHIW